VRKLHPKPPGQPITASAIKMGPARMSWQDLARPHERGSSECVEALRKSRAYRADVLKSRWEFPDGPRMRGSPIKKRQVWAVMRASSELHGNPQAARGCAEAPCKTTRSGPDCARKLAHVFCAQANAFCAQANAFCAQAKAVLRASCAFDKRGWGSVSVR
jgi:hypothetical protein